MGIFVGLVACASAAAAQESVAGSEPAPVPQAAAPSPPRPGATGDDALRARYQLRVMEGVLENAVQHGIRTVAAQMQMVAPDVIFFGSASRARGFRLDGYGVFFDVDVPTLRPSVTWSVGQLSQLRPEFSRAIQTLRRAVASAGDDRTKREAEQALRLVELQVGPLGDTSVSSASVPQGDGTREPRPRPIDPAEAYEREVVKALTDALLDYGNTLSLRSDDWLSVAARANDPGIGDRVDAVTVLLRIRARDLEALRTGTITREEARERVVTSEF